MSRMILSNSMESEEENNEKVPSTDGTDKESVENAPTLSTEEKERLSEELKIAEESTTLDTIRKNNYEILNNLLSEYLDSYIIIAYTADDDEVVMHKVNSSKDARALNALLAEISLSEFE